MSTRNDRVRQTDQADLDDQLDRLARRLPRGAGRVLRWTNHGSTAWVRVPLGFGLIIGGVFSILPVLGIWMLPLGVVVLAKDLPPLRRPAARMLAWIERRWPEKSS